MAPKKNLHRLSVAVARGDLKEAAQVLKRLIAKTPRDAVAHFNLGVILGKLGNQTEALRHLTRAAQLSPNFAEPHLAIGNLLAKNHKYEAAVSSFEHAKTLNPLMLEAPNNLGELQMRIGDYAAAIQNFALAVTLDPTNTTVLFNHAFSLEICGEFEAAIDGYLAVIAHDPNHTEALAQLSLTLAKRNGVELESAKFLAHLEKALELEPRNIKYLAQYGAVIKFIGTRDLARDAFDRITRLTPETKDEASIKAWAHLMNDQPQAAFAIEQDSLSILPFDELIGIHGKAESLLAMLPTCSGKFPKNSVRPIILAAASGDYAELYADKFVASAVTTSPGCNIHLHLINPGRYQAQEALAKFPSDRVTWTSEDIAPESSKSVYASRRFVRLPQFIERTKSVVVCLDIDSLVNADIAPSIASITPFDALIYERPTEVYLHQMVAAGFLAISPTKNGIEFAKFIASYILHFEVSGEPRWFIDQLAIVAAKAWFAANNKQAVVKCAPQATLDWSLKPNSVSLVWTAKGKTKNFIQW